MDTILTWLADHWDSIMTILNTFGLLLVGSKSVKKV